jgi:hypothetical protein
MKSKLCTYITLNLVAFSAITATFSACAGGLGSTVGGGTGNTANGDYSAVGGGYYNNADGLDAEVAGGYGNFAVAPWSTVPGGSNNFAGGDSSFAGGSAAHVRSAEEAGTCCGDEGTFFWSDAWNSPPQLSTSTGPNQFIVKANGGFSLNAAPINPNVVMTIAASQTNPHYASIQLMDHSYPDGILVSSGDASKGANNASFYIDQYNGSAQTRRLSIDALGKLTITNQAYKPGGGSWAASSDARLKTNVRPLGHALDRMLELKGVTFEYSHPDGGMHPEGTFSGFIAQDVEKVFPNWIGHDNDGYLTVGPQGFEAITVEALRELKTSQDDRVAKLEHDNTELRDLVANQTKAISDLRRDVAAMTNVAEFESRHIAAADDTK